MICSQCGAMSDAGQRFCYNCGARLNETVQAALRAEPQAYPPPSNPLQPGSYSQPSDPYQAYPNAAPPITQIIPNSGLAIASLVTGIISWVVLPILLPAIIAVVLGHMARREIRQANGRLAGDGMAMVGLVLGYAQVVLALVGGCLFVMVILFAAFA